MTDNNFLSRWSRRKQDVKASEDSRRRIEPGDRSEASAADGERGASVGSSEGQPGMSGGAERSSPDALLQDGGGSQPELPRIEDLTAESDISAFLRSGVPQAVRIAALRRAWSLDPAIRDFVGPAEYAYDFNNPATIPGFGSGPGWDPRTAAEYVQKIVNRSGADSVREPVAATPDGATQPELNSVRRAPDTGSTPARGHNEPAQETWGGGPPNDPDQAQQAEQPATDQPALPPLARHGGAMPR